MADADDVARAWQGKDIWNDWAQANPGRRVDFSGEEFFQISFAGFNFPGSSDFTNTKFIGDVDFHHSEFSEKANFSSSVFTGEVDFSDSKFFDVDFSDSCFHMGAFFIGSEFVRAATFSRCKIRDFTYFNNSKFSYFTAFDDAIFFDWVEFSGGSFSSKTSFSKSSFGGVADFSDRKFNGPTDFRVEKFSQVPKFYGASIHQGTDFGEIDEIFTDFQSDGAEQSYRTLKLAMGQYQARTEEAAFAALELKARRYRLKREAKENLGWKRFVTWAGFSSFAERCAYCLWEKCSNSGRSFFRPLGIYLASLPVFAASYVLLAQCWLWCEGLHYSFLKQFPFGAAFRGSPSRIPALEEALFDLNGSGLPLWGVTLLNAAQSITALILIFLMGLGIRHKFRLR